MKILGYGDLDRPDRARVEEPTGVFNGAVGLLLSCSLREPQSFSDARDDLDAEKSSVSVGVWSKNSISSWGPSHFATSTSAIG